MLSAQRMKKVRPIVLVWIAALSLAWLVFLIIAWEQPGRLTQVLTAYA